MNCGISFFNIVNVGTLNPAIRLVCIFHLPNLSRKYIPLSAVVLVAFLKSIYWEALMNIYSVYFPTLAIKSLNVFIP